MNRPLRRTALAAVTLALALALSLLPASSGPGRSPAVQQAIRKGCEYLLRQQQEGVGAYGTENRLALTSMATLALLSTGSTPRRGPYAAPILQSVRWTLERQRPKGHFWDESNGYSGVHNHGYAMILLTQVYGECGRELDERIARSLPRAAEASVKSQHPNGGFGYFLYNRPDPGTEMYTGDEASTTISQIQAFRGARNAGFAIDGVALDKAERYIYRSQHKPTGGFIYSLKNGRVSFQDGSNTPTFAITAASACVLNALGTYRGPALERAIQYMESFRPPSPKDVHFFYYGHYYAAQVMNQIGGERAEAWRAAVIKALLARQQADGSFPQADDSHMPGRDGAILNTAWAVQILTMEDGVLPLFER